MSEFFQAVVIFANATLKSFIKNSKCRWHPLGKSYFLGFAYHKTF